MDGFNALEKFIYVVISVRFPNTKDLILRILESKSPKKPISFKNNLKPPIDPKICTVQPLILCKQKGFETKSGTFKVVCDTKSYILSSQK